jgi:Flp pilus assembly protein TadG
VRSGDSGQATLEAALVLPVVLIALLLIVQVGVVVRDALALVQAAREGARAVAITARDDDATEAVHGSAGSLDAGRIAIAVSPDESSRGLGDAVTITLAYTEHLSIPVVSRIVALELPLRASATTRQERDVATTPGPSPP